MWSFCSTPVCLVLYSLLVSVKAAILNYRVKQDGDNARESVRKWFLKSDADHRDKLLACGALIVSELRLQVLEETEFTCSAGIAHNKVRKQ